MPGLLHVAVPGLLPVDVPAERDRSMRVTELFVALIALGAALLVGFAR